MLTPTLIKFSLLMVFPSPHVDSSKCSFRKWPEPPRETLEKNYIKWMWETISSSITENLTERASKVPQVQGSQLYIPCGLRITYHLVSQLNTETIEGGSRVPETKWPWFAILKTISEDGEESICGGSLLNWYWIMTAAHCVYDAKNITVKLGSVQVDDEDPLPVFVQLKESQNVYIHPDFRPGVYGNDIALIRIRGYVRYSPYAIPVCMPPRHKPFGPKDTCFMVGVGKVSGKLPRFVNEVEVKIMEQHLCARYMAQENIHAGDRMFCNGMYNNRYKRNHGACAGDSGSPVQHLRQGRWYLTGVVESTHFCLGKNGPDGLVNVSSFRRWTDSYLFV